MESSRALFAGRQASTRLPTLRGRASVASESELVFLAFGLLMEYDCHQAWHNRIEVCFGHIWWEFSSRLKSALHHCEAL